MSRRKKDSECSAETFFRILTDHRKRNYTFNLNGAATLDALVISNEFRFPNHDEESNCAAISETKL